MANGARFQYNDAIIAYQSAINATPVNPRAYFYLGATFEQMGKRQKAIEALKESLRQDPLSAEALNYLAYLYAEEGINLEEGLRFSEKSLELEPANGAYRDTLGWIYVKLGRFEEAQKELEAAAEAVPDDPVIQQHLRELYFRQGQK